jgi:hypothetical protein
MFQWELDPRDRAARDGAGDRETPAEFAGD